MELESLPDEVVASVEVRDAFRRRTAERSPSLEFVISDLSRWHPFRPVRVAFLDGDTALHADVVGATEQITGACGLVLDFGLDEATGGYRRWTEADRTHAADIRVGFDMPGYFSLVGTDATDTSLSGGRVGGMPHQRSLNLGGYATARPQGWEGTTRHEFMHALAFHHAHQNLRGPCAEEFRWEDDDGYDPTTDERGRFVADAAGRLPGIYTYLAGPPNGWPRAKVDHNLRVDTSDEVTVGAFDPASVMLYRFAPFFYRSDPSECAPTGDGQDLSAGDERGLRLLYPRDEADGAELRERASTALSAVVLKDAAESGRPDVSPYRRRLVERLTDLAGT